jgi:EAL domain-containing protein (putative c-di-GMP-specific phosphodiesterase class I)
LENDKIAGVETLVRWEHPQRGLLLPKEFVSVAEETGLIVRIGQWVLREAGKQARIWQERYSDTPPLTISVNLSTREFFHPKLVAEVLDESEIDATSLQLEITERAMATNGTSSTDRTLRNVKRMGVQLAIGDFGLGYSSLSYLKRFPVDFLKIDRSFIAGLGEEPNGVSTKDTEIVKAMIELTHALGLQVIAEGVENAEQLARLRQMKCDLVQGNYFSEPDHPSDSHYIATRYLQFPPLYITWVCVRGVSEAPHRGRPPSALQVRLSSVYNSPTGGK